MFICSVGVHILYTDMCTACLENLLQYTSMRMGKETLSTFSLQLRSLNRRRRAAQPTLPQPRELRGKSRHDHANLCGMQARHSFSNGEQRTSAAQWSCDFHKQIEYLDEHCEQMICLPTLEECFGANQNCRVETLSRRVAKGFVS